MSLSPYALHSFKKGQRNIEQQIVDAFYQPTIEFYYNEGGPNEQYISEGKILNGLMEIDKLIYHKILSRDISQMFMSK